MIHRQRYVAATWQQYGSSDIVMDMVMGSMSTQNVPCDHTHMSEIVYINPPLAICARQPPRRPARTYTARPYGRGRQYDFIYALRVL